MALQQAETHKGLELPEGYWALRTVGMNLPEKTVHITFGLYKDAAAYDSNPVGNVLAVSDTYIIPANKYDATLPPESLGPLAIAIFIYVKGYINEYGEPSPLANAEIVP